MTVVLNRRRFLLGAAAVTAAGLGAYWVPRWTIDPPITGDDSWARFGEAYLAAHPDERDPKRLRQLLQGLSNEKLATQIRQDFEQGATVTLLGWILSRTEGRMLALRYLGEK